MQVKQWLFRARNLDQMLNATQRQRQRAKALAEKTTPSYSKDGGGGGSDFHGKFERYIELCEECDRIEAELMAVQTEILKAIMQLEDNRHRALLTDYYCNCLTWEQTAVNLGYTYRQTMRLHGYALEALKDVIECHNDTVI